MRRMAVVGHTSKLFLCSDLEADWLCRKFISLTRMTLNASRSALGPLKTRYYKVNSILATTYITYTATGI